MAGKNETPRQKMIGMMYLVLTALLVLQVSNTVLEKFVIINKSFEENITLQKEKNIQGLERVKKTVAESGNRKNDMAIVSTIEILRKKTQKIIQFIDHLKVEMIQKNGGRDKKGRVKNIKNDGVVSNIMINQEKGYELKKIMNAYSQFLSKILEKKIEKIALDAHEDPFFVDDSNQKGKDFVLLNFEKTPLSAALATLSQYNAKILRMESNAIEELGRKIGAQDFKFDTLVPMVKPKSNIVAAGARYEADLFLTASSSGVSPIMMIDGKKIKVKNGLGKISFLASSNQYDKEGLARKTFQANIIVKAPGGKDSVFKQAIEYFVAKPVIQVQSAAVQALYLNCGNDINIQVPALGKEYNPNFKVIGGAMVTGRGKGLLTVIPKSTQVKIHVYNNSSMLGTQTFNVRSIPKPEIKLTSKGKSVNAKEGFPIPGPRSLELSAIPDESFKNFLPKDARYRVAKWEIILARGSRAIEKQKVNGPSVNLRRFAAVAKPGDRIVVEVQKVERMNFKNEIENVKFGTAIYNITLT